MFALRGPMLALYLGVSWLILLGTSSAANCVPQPLSLRIDNVTIPTGLKRRGILMDIGGPGQEFSFIPMWSNNNTFLYGPKCDRTDFTAARCQAYRGGLYDPANSTTEGVPDKDYIPLQEPWSSSSYSIMTETLNLGKDFTLQKFPIARVKDPSNWNLQDYATQNIIGLGTGSTLISSLKNAKRIMSRAVGIHWGLDGVTSKDQSLGSFVLGGYDKAKTYGDGLTQLLTDKEECASKIVISIQDIVLNFRNGTDVSLFPSTSGGTALQACLLPERPVLMDMPRNPYFNNLEDATGNLEASRSYGIDFWNVILGTDYPLYDGDLTFKLDKNLQITIPNHQLIVPERRLVNDGTLATNASRPVMRINALQEISEGAFPVLGRYFLTTSYVMVNEDANQFTIWEANPTSSEDLVAVDEDNKVLNAQASCTIQPTASAEPGHGDNTTTTAVGGTSNTSEPIADSSPAPSGISTGAIAGIAIGIGALVLAGIAFLFWRRMKKRKAAAAAATNLTSPEIAYYERSREYMKETGQTPKMGYPTQGFPHFIPQEMSSEQQPKMKPVELP